MTSLDHCRQGLTNWVLRSRHSWWERWCRTSFNTAWVKITMWPLKTWLTVGTHPKVQGPINQRNLASVRVTMASTPKSQPMHQWSSTKWWEQPRIFSKGLPTLLQHQGLYLGEACHLLRYFAKGPNSRRSTWPSGRHPSLSIEIKEAKPCWNGSIDSAAKERLDTSKPSTSSVPFLRKESGR